MEQWPSSISVREGCRRALTTSVGSLPEANVDLKAAVAAVDVLTSEEAEVALENIIPAHMMITCDGTPFDISVRFSDKRPEMRCSFVPNPSLPAAWGASLRIADRLEATFGASLRECREICDLFAPRDESALPLHFAAAFAVSGPPTFKVYFHPRSIDTLRQALGRLLPSSVLEKLGPSLLKPSTIMVSLDLIDLPEPRIKIYQRNTTFSPQELNVFATLLERYELGAVEGFARSLYGAMPTPTALDAELGLTMIDVAGGGRVAGLTQYYHCNTLMFDLPDDDVLTDGNVKVGVHKLFEHLSISGDGYDRLIDSFAMDDLSEELGIHAYVSILFPASGKPRSVTAYLNPRFFLKTRGFVIGGER